MSSFSPQHWLALKVPPVVVFIVALFGVWICDYFWPMSGLLGDTKVLIASFLIAGGLLSGIAGVVSFKLAHTTLNPVNINKASSLVCSGIFRISRNPMYLGMLLIILGLVARLEHPVGLFLAISFVWYMNRFQIVPEESALTNIFGQSYVNYLRQVRRWL